MVVCTTEAVIVAAKVLQRLPADLSLMACLCLLQGLLGISLRVCQLLLMLGAGQFKGVYPLLEQLSASVVDVVQLGVQAAACKQQGLAPHSHHIADCDAAQGTARWCKLSNDSCCWHLDVLRLLIPCYADAEQMN